MHFLFDQFLRAEKPIIFLLMPGLGKSSMVPFFVEMMKKALDEDDKILIIVPEPFLSANLHSKYLQMDDSYDLAHQKIKSLDDLERVTVLSVDKLSDELINTGFNNCGVILDESDYYCDFNMRLF